MNEFSNSIFSKILFKSFKLNNFLNNFYFTFFNIINNKFLNKLRKIRNNRNQNFVSFTSM